MRLQRKVNLVLLKNLTEELKMNINCVPQKIDNFLKMIYDGKKKSF